MLLCITFKVQIKKLIDRCEGLQHSTYITTGLRPTKPSFDKDTHPHLLTIYQLVYGFLDTYETWAPRKIASNISDLSLAYHAKLLKPLVTIRRLISSFKTEHRNTDCFYINDLPMNNE